MSSHDCVTCERTRKFREALDRVPDSDKEFWKDIFAQLFHAEDDRNYYHSIVDGSWPTADVIIRSYREKNLSRTTSECSTPEKKQWHWIKKIGSAFKRFVQK